MGVEYYVACRTCKLVRDVDKCYSFIRCQNAKAAESFGESFFSSLSIRYRTMLVMGFLTEHMGHNVTAFSEQSVEEQEFYPEGKLKKGYREDNRDFWGAQDEERSSVPATAPLPETFPRPTESPAGRSR